MPLLTRGLLTPVGIKLNRGCELPIWGFGIKILYSL
jgi:hypothetical protein